MSHLDRRSFLAAAGAGLAGLHASRHAHARQDAQPVQAVPPDLRDVKAAGDDHRGMCMVGSPNAVPAFNRALEARRQGAYMLDALVAGVRIVEDDPSDMTVGYGGLPNEDGIVELDASVMDGPMHRAGSVGALRNIKNPAAVALEVLRRTDHVMLVGEGALRFARAMGFKEQDLLTDAAREAWLKWRANLNKDDDWLDEDQRLRPPEALGSRPATKSGTKPDGTPATRPSSAAPVHRDPGAPIRPGLAIPYTTGTIHCSGVDPAASAGPGARPDASGGVVAAVTSTSGLSYKLSGRLGDSPIVGAGMYCDNAIGAAGATGRGEATMQVCGAFSIVQHIEAGLTPTQACLAVLRRIAERTREPRLLDARGRPAFNLSLYAARRDGAFGGATMHEGGQFAVLTGDGPARLEPAAFLFAKDPAPTP